MRVGKESVGFESMRNIICSMSGFFEEESHEFWFLAETEKCRG